MRHLTLTQYRPSGSVALGIEERDLLHALVPDLTISAAEGTSDSYVLTAGARIGNVIVGDLAIQIRPKIPMDRLLFLLSYSLDRIRWRKDPFDFEQEESLVEAVIPAFVTHLQAAFRAGLLQGYRVLEDALPTVRGRVLFSEQVRRRHGIFPPVEVRFDEFTEDIIENQLIKSAIAKLSRFRIRSEEARRSLRRFDTALGNVSAVEFRLPLPEVIYTRLNERYRPAIELAKLILRSMGFETSHGSVRGSAFLVDMNKAFEDFVYIALREALHLSERQFPQGGRGRSLRLDERRLVRLRPDLSWWEDGRCVFVGDVKYKRINSEGIEHPDLYQLLSYAIATGLPGGLLIYSAGEGEPVIHRTVNVGKKLEVLTLDLSGSIESILAQVEIIASRIGRSRNLVNADSPDWFTLPS